VGEPIVTDARGGLTQEVLDGLRQAERVTFATRAPPQSTVALGYWIGEQLTIVVTESDPLFDMVGAAAGFRARDAVGSVSPAA